MISKNNDWWLDFTTAGIITGQDIPIRTLNRRVLIKKLGPVQFCSAQCDTQMPAQRNVHKRKSAVKPNKSNRVGTVR